MEGCIIGEWGVHESTLCSRVLSWGEFVFQTWEGASFLSEGMPHGGISFDGGGGVEKNCRIWGAPPCSPTIGKPGSDGQIVKKVIKTVYICSTDEFLENELNHIKKVFH